MREEREKREGEGSDKGAAREKDAGCLTAAEARGKSQQTDRRLGRQAWSIATHRLVGMDLEVPAVVAAQAHDQPGLEQRRRGGLDRLQGERRERKRGGVRVRHKSGSARRQRVGIKVKTKRRDSFPAFRL